MSKFTMALMAATLGVTLAGCAAPSLRQTTNQQEDLLTAAGFNMHLADTPGKLAQLQQLPSYQVRMRLKDNQPVYFYADPQFCQCLYTGNETNYQTYRRLAIERNIANEQIAAAEMNQDVAMGMWGPVW